MGCSLQEPAVVKFFSLHKSNMMYVYISILISFYCFHTSKHESCTKPLPFGASSRPYRYISSAAAVVSHSQSHNGQGIFPYPSLRPSSKILLNTADASHGCKRECAHVCEGWEREEKGGDQEETVGREKGKKFPLQ